MSTRARDHLPGITELKSIPDTVLNEVGGVLMMPNLYPLQITLIAIAIVKQKTTGTGTLIFLDYFGDVELGRIEFTDSDWKGRSVKLSGIPTLDPNPKPGEEPTAYIEFQLKTSDPAGTAKVYKAGVQVG